MHRNAVGAEFSIVIFTFASGDAWRYVAKVLAERIAPQEN
jgi:hypothetical protein